MSDKRHPRQPIEKDERGTRRFKENKVVRRLLDNGLDDMNRLCLAVARGELPKEDLRQFYQLIGYSEDGYYECFDESADREYYGLDISEDS